ncbi:MAG: hybrid sensor histidine kinase/response regulator [Symploca sp. SIO1C4]|uniref:histidine kinase n=1 Tax=Symploca sp. SIO1C4 TaxID=2607765 RepID=A0A6B3NEA4_9CYAN|nr:hybrid sensor histidine kinase/response regulator [Symploca sp. SIO1C4]
MNKILLIEDEEEIRENIFEILTAEDFEVIDADNGCSGVKLAQQELPDLIICDVMMPELDGYGVLSQLRQNPITDSIPFVFLTAKAAKEDLRQGMELGADDYLTKPFTRNELLKAITIRLEKQVTVKRNSQKKLDELRCNITHSLPHELHTPLNGILGFSRFMIDEYDSIEPEEVLEMLGHINESAERLYRLTQNFLLYADLELIEADPERIKALRASDPKSFVKKIITEVALKKAQQTNREEDLQLELYEAVVLVSAPKLQKLVEEIIDNAFKFSTTGTPVLVKSSYTENIFNLSIIDQGRGMTAAQIASWGAYIQFERKLYEQQGSGLGLSIARSLVKLYGGELAIASVPGQQTIVHVSLPATESLSGTY